MFFYIEVTIENSALVEQAGSGLYSSKVEPDWSYDRIIGIILLVNPEY